MNNTYTYLLGLVVFCFVFLSVVVWRHLSHRRFLNRIQKVF